MRPGAQVDPAQAVAAIAVATRFVATVTARIARHSNDAVPLPDEP
jgi:hypothetical protein